MIGGHKVPPPRDNRWFNTPGVIGLIYFQIITWRDIDSSKSKNEVKCETFPSGFFKYVPGNGTT